MDMNYVLHAFSKKSTRESNIFIKLYKKLVLEKLDYCVFTLEVNPNNLKSLVEYSKFKDTTEETKISSTIRELYLNEDSLELVKILEDNALKVMINCTSWNKMIDYCQTHLNVSKNTFFKVKVYN